jgi:hypothetical protein
VDADRIILTVRRRSASSLAILAASASLATGCAALVGAEFEDREIRPSATGGAAGNEGGAGVPDADAGTGNGSPDAGGDRSDVAEPETDASGPDADASETGDERSLEADAPVSDRVEPDAPRDVDSRDSDGEDDVHVVARAPSDFGGLVFWLDASKGLAWHGAGVSDGGPIDHWADQSSHHNDAFQSNSGSQPALRQGDAGRPAVAFSGGSTLRIADTDPLSTDGSMRWGTGDFALFVVGNYENSSFAINGCFYQKSEVDLPWRGVGLFGNFSIPTNSTRFGMGVGGGDNNLASAESGCNDSVTRLVVARRVGSRLELRINGAISSTFDAAGVAKTNVDAPGRDAVVGHGYNTGVQGLIGEISEMVAVVGSLSELEARSLEAYLKSKYRL